MMTLYIYTMLVVAIMAVLAGISLGVGDGLRDKKPTNGFYSKIFYMITGGLWFGAMVLVSVVMVWHNYGDWIYWFYGIWITPVLALIAYIIRSWGIFIVEKSTHQRIR